LKNQKQGKVRDFAKLNLTCKGVSCPVLESFEKSPYQWVTVESELSYITASNLNRVSKDSISAPFAHLSDGCILVYFCTNTANYQDIDLIFTRNMSKDKLAKLLLGLDDGSYVQMEEVEYHKVKAFILEPIDKNGYIMVDGELINMEPIKAEAHRGLVQFFLS
jgi:diacylglycerol kinase family enzyme